MQRSDLDSQEQKHSINLFFLPVYQAPYFQLHIKQLDLFSNLLDCWELQTHAF